MVIGQVEEISHIKLVSWQTKLSIKPKPNQRWPKSRTTLWIQIPTLSRTVQGEDFQMAAWPSNWFWAHSTTSLTWHVFQQQCSYKIHTSVKPKSPLAPSFFMDLCFGELWTPTWCLWNLWTNKPVAPFSALPYLRPPLAILETPSLPRVAVVDHHSFNKAYTQRNFDRYLVMCRYFLIFRLLAG